jgi:hypothetical protein
MGSEELKKSIGTWKEIVDLNAFVDSVGAMAESTAMASPIIDRMSTWAAAGVATIAGLAITNIDKMISVYSRHEVKYLLSFLAISIFFAIIQKYFASLCESSLRVSDEIKSKLPQVLSVYEQQEKQIQEISEKHDLDIKAEYDFAKVVLAYMNLYPKWALLIARSIFKKATTDRNYSHKNLIKMFVYQTSCAFLQYIAILVFVILSAVFV